MIEEPVVVVMLLYRELVASVEEKNLTPAAPKLFRLVCWNVITNGDPALPWNMPTPAANRVPKWPPMDVMYAGLPEVLIILAAVAPGAF